MTGDSGQRYEIRSVGWLGEGESVVGWAVDLEAAGKLMSASLKAPGCTRATIFDRQEKCNVITRYGGVLR